MESGIVLLKEVYTGYFDFVEGKRYKQITDPKSSRKKPQEA